MGADVTRGAKRASAALAQGMNSIPKVRKYLFILFRILPSVSLCSAIHGSHSSICRFPSLTDHLE